LTPSIRRPAALDVHVDDDPGEEAPRVEVVDVLGELPSEDGQALSQEDAITAGNLMAIISSQPVDAEANVQVDLEHLLLESLEDLTLDKKDRIRVSAKEFITFFARINVIRNRNAARLTDKQFQLEATKWAATGNSRDFLTRSLFCCPQKEWGCSFSAKDMGKLEQHVLFCRISENDPKEEGKESLFKCRKAGCRETFRRVTAHNRHEQDHDFAPQQCSRGCTDGKWFTTTGTWKYHVAHAHDDLWDTSTTCAAPVA
jgi:hypothetical protein